MPLSLNGKTHGFLGSGPSFVTQPWMIKRLFQWFIFLYQTHPLYLQCKIPIFELLRFFTNFELSNKIKGQLVSKANYQAVNSSKKRTNEFVFTTM